MQLLATDLGGRLFIYACAVGHCVSVTEISGYRPEGQKRSLWTDSGAHPAHTWESFLVRKGGRNA
jgi:hypothetical protein